MPEVRRLNADEWRACRDVRLRALDDSPDAFGSTLHRERERADQEWVARVESGAASRLDLPLVVAEGSDLHGLAWGKILPAAPDTAHVYEFGGW